MKRTAASRFLILLLICGAVLSLPGVLLAAVGGQSPCCSHCQGAGPGLASNSCCCQQSDQPGPCRTSGQCGGLTCPYGSATLASISATVAGTPTWAASPHMPALVTASSKSIPPNIFHPPELGHLSRQS